MPSNITPGQAPNQCNIVIKGNFDSFDHQLPVLEFVDRLREDKIPNNVTVLDLEEAFLAGTDSEVRRVLDDRANELANDRPTLQFAVEGSFQRVPNGFELKYENELYRLDRVFGARLQKEENDWLVVPY